MLKKLPYLIMFSRIGRSRTGYISVLEMGKTPFEVKRIYYTYYTPESIIRGRHAHKKTEQVLIAVNGKITINTEALNGKKKVFILDKPNVGLYIPPLIWHTMKYSHSSVQLVVASSLFDEKDYIRNYKDFINLCRANEKTKKRIKI